MLSAERLLERFAVYGRFYEKTIAGVPEQLRDRLEIAPRDMPLQEVVAREPDLLVVMMNPGASRALDALWDDGAEQGFVPAVPDRTQYQIMRLLVAANGLGMAWAHARILNLSDLRTPKSELFIQKLALYATDASHSVFSNTRRAECETLFANKTTPVLLGWGLNANFGPWADLALAAARGHPQLGLSADGRLFRHPLPQRFDLQVAWLEQLQTQIQALPR
jgi:hypothetical protein